MDHGLGRQCVLFVVLAQTTLCVAPGKGALNHPSFGQHRKAGLYAFADMNGRSPLFTHVLLKASPVTCISAPGLGRRCVDHGQIPQHTAFDGVSPVGRMHMHRPDQPLGVDRNLAAAPFDLFASVEASRLAFGMGFDALGVDDEIAGAGLTPFF